MFSSLLIANRGEIAIRIARAAAELGVRSVAVYSEDDANSLHVRRADDARPLGGQGVAAYLDGDAIIAAARDAGAEALHPGYGFLSENAGFARRCLEAGLCFVGPGPDTLEVFGDKVRARSLAVELGVPVLAGTTGPTTLEGARAFLTSLGSGSTLMVKAVAGGGGRGMRVVRTADELEEAFERCRSEANAAFGSDALFVEQFVARARHIEVQVLGDGTGAVAALGERDCSLQRRNQKVVEIAPAPFLDGGLRRGVIEAAVRLAQSVRYANAGTFEFLVDEERTTFAFIEANPRLQVEHTVTEEITGVDIVQAQLLLAAGATLSELGLDATRRARPNGFAIQCRVNLETLGADGLVRPASGVISAYEPPSGAGVRVDSHGFVGLRPNPRFDPLVAKVIVRSGSPDFARAAAQAYRALCEFRLDGIASNLGFLENLLSHPDVVAGHIYTRFIDDHLGELVETQLEHPRRYIEGGAEAASARPRVGASVDSGDPLAVLSYGKGEMAGHEAASIPHRVDVASSLVEVVGPEGTVAINAPMQGTVVSVDVADGDAVHEGHQVLVMEAMKMEHVVRATVSGYVRQLTVTAGDTVWEGDPLAFIEEADLERPRETVAHDLDLDHLRDDLADVRTRHGYGLDANRPDAVARRRKTGQRTVRENIEDLCDADSFIEYAPLVVAAQRRRRSMQDLIERTPGDGLVGGIGTVNGAQFGDDRARCVLLSYDYTVLAGTQGLQNHRKKDRLFEIAEKWRLPVIFFTEGGGGRPGDTDGIGSGLDCLAFAYWGGLSGLVPLIGVNSGRCFAGNAAILGCCDVVIATENSNIGMGGPAMIEGGGLGVFRPEEIGPMSVQVPNGVVDVAVKDEAEAVAVAKKYLSYFQGPLVEWTCADQRQLRTVIPENRLRVYDVRKVIELLCDTDSVLELRRHFGVGMVTALARVEGRPIGLIANNPTHLAGAIDSDGADKAARFMQLCDAFDIPLLFLCDTPGMMVGPEVEKTALVRHCCRMFVVGASVTVPFFTIVLRKGYGLGAQAMAGGSFKAGIFTVAWPTGEFGGMGLEGAVKLGYRNELAAIDDPAERKKMFDEMVARMYEHGKALSTASHFEIDDVIDPFDSRRWIVRALKSVPAPEPRVHKKRPCVDTW